MSVSLICWGRFLDARANKVTVPAPSTEPGKPWLWDFLASEVHELSKVGFQRLQLPPAAKAQGGAGAGCDGYGLYDPRDLGSKDQQGSIPTRYGTIESLRRLVAMAHSNGVSVDLDIVLHQLDGGEGATYRYLGSDKKTLNGRGPMHPGCFRHMPGSAATQPGDDVPDPANDAAFGDEKVYQHCNPARYTIADALDCGEWTFKTTGADGGRIDDVKGLWPDFVAEFVNHGVMARKNFYSEYFDGNPANVNNWATSPPLNGVSGVEDFPMHFAIMAACNRFTAGPLDGAGYAAENSSLAYGFVENPDTDLSLGEQVISCKLLGYAFLLTVPCRTALIYGKDYFGSDVWPGAYGLKPFLDNLIYINQVFAFGGLVTRWRDDKVIVLERDGRGGLAGTSAGLLTALNFDTWNARQITCMTGFGANQQLHDYTGHHADIRTNGNGEATFKIPANSFGAGQSYLCFSRAGASREIRPRSHPTSQTFFGANDLDLPPVNASKPVSVGRIFVEAKREVFFAATGAITIRLLDGAAAVPGNKPLRSGWYEVQVSTASHADLPFEVTVTYQAPQTM